jgi:hypothetical protein
MIATSHPALAHNEMRSPVCSVNITTVHRNPNRRISEVVALGVDNHPPRCTTLADCRCVMPFSPTMPLHQVDAAVITGRPTVQT